MQDCGHLKTFEVWRECLESRLAHADSTGRSDTDQANHQMGRSIARTSAHTRAARSTLVALCLAPSFGVFAHVAAEPAAGGSDWGERDRINTRTRQRYTKLPTLSLVFLFTILAELLFTRTMHIDYGG